MTTYHLFKLSQELAKNEPSINYENLEFLLDRLVIKGYRILLSEESYMHLPLEIIIYKDKSKENDVVFNFKDANTSELPYYQKTEFTSYNNGLLVGNGC